MSLCTLQKWQQHYDVPMYPFTLLVLLLVVVVVLHTSTARNTTTSCKNE